MDTNHTYVSIHTHSEYSLNDGISMPSDLAKRAAELGMPAMALTDHGRMAGLIDFEKACHANNIKPILGMEAYITGMGRSRKERVNYNSLTKDLEGKPGHEKTCYHLILLAATEQGYSNLTKLTTESYSTGMYYSKPRIDYDLLEQYHEGLIVSSACMLGELSCAVQDNDIDKAKRIIAWNKRVFDDNYFIEIQNHGLDAELKAMKTLRELADEYDVRTVLANDSHYTYKKDANIQKTVMLLAHGKSWADADVSGSFFDNPEAHAQHALSEDGGDFDPFFETSDELYVKSYDEMLAVGRMNGGDNGRAEQELANTIEIANRCTYEIPFIDPEDTDAYILPKYDIKTDVRYDEYEKSHFVMPSYIEEACVKELHEEGYENVNTLSDFMSDDNFESLNFLMWLCSDGMKKRVMPKIEAGGKPMPDNMWITNKPEKLEIIHTHMSPDENWIKQQMDAGKTKQDILQIYKDRLAYETGVVVAKKFVNYFLIVQSYVNYVRAQGEMVGTGRGCLTPDNMILTEEGTKPISDMHIGDIVYDECGKKALVIDKFIYNIDEDITKVITAGDISLTLTRDHLVLVKRQSYSDDKPEWIHATDIQTGDALCRKYGNHYVYRTVISVDTIHYVGKVYDLKVDTQNEPSYTTEAGIVHNSGAGSLLNYLSGITSVDPLPNKLLFFRFLNKDRKGYPDIDCDFSSHGRDDILWPHLRQVYGKDNTSMVATYTYYWGKAAIKAAAKALFDRTNDKKATRDERLAGRAKSVQSSKALCDLIDDKPKLDLQQELTDDTDSNGNPLGNTRLKELIKSDETYQQIIDLALKMQGMISGESQHASAYILSPHDITHTLPLMIPKTDRKESEETGEKIDNYIIQYDGREVQDQLGYVKLDLLCINDLEVITETLRKIHDVYDIDINIDNIPLDCKTVFDFLQQGKTAGVFQFDGSIVPRRLIMDGHADNINDLSMINALDRPGALGMGMDKEFIERKADPDKITYFSPDAKEVLKDTYGLACFQEGLMLLSESKHIVGFTPGEADTMRKILAHKDKAKIQGIIDLAHKRAKENNVPEKTVDYFCDMAVASGSYSFNHCTSGDTMLYRAASCWRDTKYPTHEIPVEEVYRRFNASAARNSPDAPIRQKYRAKDPNRGLFVICRDTDGRARRHKVKNVFQQGIQPVYRVTLENGKSGKFTANHRLQAENGYKMVSELISGEDSLWCCDFEYEKCHKRYNYSNVKDGKHKGSRAIGKHTYGSGKNCVFYTNGGYTAFQKYHDSFDGICEICGRKLEPDERYETHHIDGNRYNNEPNNLQNLCVSCHKKAHYAMGRVHRGQKGYPTYLSKVVSVEYVGEEMTYDVEIDSEEHNFFANGICSHNSHSLAYAVIAYRGAFLKTFFPECFLSSVAEIKPQMKGKEKIPDYLNEAKLYGITILPPDVNESQAEFSVPERYHIRYGLDRIKDVGTAAQAIVDERNAHGPYTDLTDFLYRVPDSVSKKAIFALIEAGAMDNLGWTRRMLDAYFDDLMKFRRTVIKQNKAAIANQLSFGFDNLGVQAITFGSDKVMTFMDADSAFNDGKHHNEHDYAILPPSSLDYSEYEYMQKAHDVLGLYFSRTPEDDTQLGKLQLDEELRAGRFENAKQSMPGVTIDGKHYKLVNVKDIPELADKQNIVFTARISDQTFKFVDTVGYKMFKSGTGATLYISDWGVNAESKFGVAPVQRTARVTCFNRVWDTIKAKPVPGLVVKVWGHVTVSDKFGRSVVADGVQMLPYDSVLFNGRPDKAQQLNEQLAKIAAQLHDPESSKYEIARICFDDRESWENFINNDIIHARYDDLYSDAIITYNGCSKSDSDMIYHMRIMRSLARYLVAIGASLSKTRLPIAQSELARRF